ncbi:MAG: hypothetical protein M1814_000550 [Vezdaea aestivalis]|nr:MAG: hypothetical protein M1814_000550 [Vezdaea aestivalis]
MYEAVAAIAACKTSPIVRVAANEPWMVGRALDSGAHGILVPRLHTAEDARRFVASANFPPKGHRGFGSPFPMAAFDTSDPRHYLREANDSIVRIVQIETKEALANVREIASVDGIDILFVGPFDLSIAIGHPLVDGMHEELKRAIQIILEAALKAGKKAGIYCVSTDMAKLFAKMGFHFISVVPDVMCFKQALTTAITAVKSNPL